MSKRACSGLRAALLERETGICGTVQRTGDRETGKNTPTMYWSLTEITGVHPAIRSPSPQIAESIGGGRLLSLSRFFFVSVFVMVHFSTS